MDDFSIATSTSSLNQHFGIDKSVDTVIVLSSDSSDDGTGQNHCKTTANICDTNKNDRRLINIQNETDELSHVSTQRSNDTNAAECNELIKDLNSLIHEVKVLGTKFQNYRNGNEVSSSDENSAYVGNGLNKLINEYSHSDSETSSTDLDSSEMKHETRIRKNRWSCSNSPRRRHNSKRKRRKYHRNCIQCEVEQSNCEMCAGGRRNDMKVAFNFNSPSKCQNEEQWSEQAYKTLTDTSEDDDDSSSSEYSEQSTPNDSKYTNKSKWIQGKRLFNLSKRMHFHNAEEKMFEPRLSDEMVLKLKRGDHRAVRYKKRHTKYLSAFCYFCESDKQFPPDYWVDRIRNHTGELAYECSVCRKPKFRSRFCCSRYAVRKIKSNFLTQKFVAYICKMCNFIQISKENIEMHVRNEHQTKQSDRRYDQIVLLPAFNSVKQPILELHDIRAQTNDNFF